MRAVAVPALAHRLVQPRRVAQRLHRAGVQYVIASRYEVGELLARDSIFISTMLSVPTITLIAGLLGAG